MRFTITEGPATVVDSITVLGIDSVPGNAQLRKPFTKFEGRPFSRVALQSLIDTAMVRLWNRGYPYAERPLTSFSVDSTTHRASIELSFFQRFLGQSVPLPTRAARITSIAVSSTPGPDSGKVSPQTVRKLMLHPAGQGLLAGGCGLEPARALLARAGAPRGCGPAARFGSRRAIPRSRCACCTRKRISTRCAWAAGWATFDCLRAQTRYSDRDLFEGAERFDFNARLSHIALCPKNVREDPSSQGINYYVSGTLRLPTLFGPRNQPSLTLFSERSSEYKAYLRMTPIGGVLAFNRDLDPRGIRPGLPLSLTARVEYGQTQAQHAVFCQLFNVCSEADIARLQQNSLLLCSAPGSRMTRRTRC